MAVRAEGRPRELLIVDDSRADSELLRMALSQLRERIRIQVVEDGDQALQYIRREGKFANAKRPDLIVLDLHLPGKDGIEVLREIRRDSRLKNVPVVMMSSSDSRRDIELAYSSHVNSYLLKSFDAVDFFDNIRAFGEYWFDAVELPAEEDVS